tara:strand:+ start:1576 stop:2211 length:636 start_codon:yes stop_codon:yes gene_type:complete
MPKQAIVKKEKQEITEAPKLAISASDIEIPRLNVVQKSSQIDGAFGAVVLDRTNTVLEPEQSANVTIISAVKAWRENVPYESEEIGRIATTEEQKAAIDADSEWGTIEFADIVMLIPKPEGGSDTAFPYPIGDEMFALGKINVNKNGYRNTYKRLATFAAFNPTASLSTRLWSFKTELITKGKYAWYVPSLTITSEEAAADVTAFVTRITS